MSAIHFDSKREALAKGKEKLKLLKNRKGWKVVVWENLGWHMRLEKGNMNLHYSPDDDTFSGFLSDTGSGGDDIFWHESFYHKDPNLVIKKKLAIAQAFVNQCQAVIDEIEK